MRFGKTVLAAISAAALIGAPVAAQAATSAGKLSISQVKRASASKKAESKLGGSSAVIYILGCGCSDWRNHPDR